MVRNRNGFWMSPKFFMSPDDGGAGGAESPAGGEPGADAGGEGASPDDAGGENKGQDNAALLAKIEQLEDALAKEKGAKDAAMTEAGKYRKELRAKQTQEEIDAANKKEAEEKQAARLQELEREVARAKSTKSVMAKLGVDEDAAGKIAECLAGCEDVDNALLLVQKAWEAKEKALRIEFGKIPGPGAGGSNEEDAEEKAAIELAKKLGRSRAEANKSVSDGLKGYIR